MSVVPTYVKSPHGTTKTDRRSFGTGTMAAMSLRTFSHGTVMWTPFAGRSDAGCAPSSSVRTSSDHTPAALRTTFASMSNVAPSASTVTRLARPSATFAMPTTRV